MQSCSCVSDLVSVLTYVDNPVLSCFRALSYRAFSKVRYINSKLYNNRVLSLTFRCRILNSTFVEGWTSTNTTQEETEKYLWIFFIEERKHLKSFYVMLILTKTNRPSTPQKNDYPLIKDHPLTNVQLTPFFLSPMTLSWRDCIIT